MVVFLLLLFRTEITISIISAGLALMNATEGCFRSRSFGLLEIRVHFEAYRISVLAKIGALSEFKTGLELTCSPPTIPYLPNRGLGYCIRCHWACLQLAVTLEDAPVSASATSSATNCKEPTPSTWYSKKIRNYRIHCIDRKMA